MVFNQVSLDLSACTQVCNAVVRVILQKCSTLEELKLDGCHLITDSAFDLCDNPFDMMIGCLSLKNLSLQVLPCIHAFGPIYNQ